MLDELAKFVREKRGGLSLREFAKRCDGISHTQIDSIERGIDPRTGKPVRPTVDTLLKISKGTGVSVSYLAALAAGETPSPKDLTNYVELPPENKKLPIIGTVKCGPDGLAFQYLEGYILIGEEYKGDVIAFRCRGDSMKDLGIASDDIAIVRQQEDVENGELAVVVVNGEEGMLKRVRKFEGGIILESANSEYPPRIITGKELETVHIVGKVLEVRKKF